MEEGEEWRERHKTLAEWTETARVWPDAPESELLNLAAFDTIDAHRDLFQVVTPVKVDVLERYLADHPNQEFVKFICRGLREGFWPNATIPESYPATWDNSERPIREEEHRAFLREHRDKEMDAGRFSASFGTDLLPGMYSSPVGVVPKAETGKFRLVVDHSAGDFSLNSMIPRDQRGFTKLDGIHALGQALLRYREQNPEDDLVVWKSDVMDAFRLMPADPLWQLKQIITIDGERHVDRCCTIGNRQTMMIFNAFMGCVIWIAVKKGLSDILAYVDDAYGFERADRMLYYKPYDEHYPAKQTRLLQLWDELGIPHKKSKQLFGRKLTIIGFEVDANAMRVTLADERRNDLILAIEDFIKTPPGGGRRGRTLREYLRLAGWINWALNVFPLLRPGLCELYSKIAGKSKMLAKIDVNKTLVRELSWLVQHLRSASGVYMFESTAWSASDADLTLYTDASGIGLGIFSPLHATGLQAPVPELPREDCATSDIFVTEALAVCSALQWARNLPERPHRLVVYTDNSNTVAMNNTLKAKRAYNSILIFTVDILIETGIHFRVLHIPGEDNIVADALSRWMDQKAYNVVPNLRIIPFIPPRAALGAVGQ